MSKDRDIIQFLPQCAVFDRELMYKLKEGSCTVKSREFNTKYDINKMGLRDDNESLKKPEIIVLGDSHAMGWGVDQDKIFASLIEKDTGMKVLNSAISSYGTAREFLMLKKLDRSNLKYLVIQYCSNDKVENSQFAQDNYKLRVAIDSQYQALVDYHINRTIYNPFGYTASILDDVKKAIRGKQNKGEVDQLTDKEIYIFLKIMQRITGVINKDTKIILLEVNRNNSNRKDFSSRVSKALTGEFAYLKGKMTILDSSKILQKSDYFILDDHMKEEGHRKLADEILGALNQRTNKPL